MKFIENEKILDDYGHYYGKSIYDAKNQTELDFERLGKKFVNIGEMVSEKIPVGVSNIDYELWSEMGYVLVSAKRGYEVKNVKKETYQNRDGSISVVEKEIGGTHEEIFENKKFIKFVKTGQKQKVLDLENSFCSIIKEKEKRDMYFSMKNNKKSTYIPDKTPFNIISWLSFIFALALCFNLFINFFSSDFNLINSEIAIWINTKIPSLYNFSNKYYFLSYIAAGICIIVSIVKMYIYKTIKSFREENEKIKLSDIFISCFVLAFNFVPSLNSIIIIIKALMFLFAFFDLLGSLSGKEGKREYEKCVNSCMKREKLVNSGEYKKLANMISEITNKSLLIPGFLSRIEDLDDYLTKYAKNNK